MTYVFSLHRLTVKSFFGKIYLLHIAEHNDFGRNGANMAKYLLALATGNYTEVAEAVLVQSFSR